MLPKEHAANLKARVFLYLSVLNNAGLVTFENRPFETSFDNRYSVAYRRRNVSVTILRNLRF